MLIDSHHHMKSLLDLRHRPVDIHQQSIGRLTGHGKTIGFREIDHGRVILHRRAELFGELGYGEKLAVIRTRRVIEPIQQPCQLGLVAERQHDSQVQTLRGWK